LKTPLSGEKGGEGRDTKPTASGVLMPRMLLDSQIEFALSGEENAGTKQRTLWSA